MRHANGGHCLQGERCAVRILVCWLQAVRRDGSAGVKTLMHADASATLEQCLNTGKGLPIHERPSTLCRQACPGHTYMSGAAYPSPAGGMPDNHCSAVCLHFDCTAHGGLHQGACMLQQMVPHPSRRRAAGAPPVKGALAAPHLPGDQRRSGLPMAAQVAHDPSLIQAHQHSVDAQPEAQQHKPAAWHHPHLHPCESACTDARPSPHLRFLQHDPASQLPFPASPVLGTGNSSRDAQVWSGLQCLECLGRLLQT